MREDIITISVVNYQESWGDKQKNIQKMSGYIRAAARAGSDMIVFPECALTGYDNEREKSKCDKMHYKLAEPITGPSVMQLAKLAEQYQMYVIFGMPERDASDPEKLYNAVAVCAPDGSVQSARKLHQPLDEGEWTTPGDRPFVFDTQWGPVGISLCYDSYQVPEIYRYTAGMGGRLHINCTACMDEAPLPNYATMMEAAVLTNNLFLVTASLAGLGRNPMVHYSGASSIMGPSSNMRDVSYYAGQPFYTKNSDQVGMFTATIDLSLADTNWILNTYQVNPVTGHPDFQPHRYSDWYRDLADKQKAE